MKLTQILRQLKKARSRAETEVKRLDAALTALGSVNGARPTGKRHISAAARARIREAQKARWRAWRRAHKR
jgi:hypothetical protein